MSCPTTTPVHKPNYTFAEAYTLALWNFIAARVRVELNAAGYEALREAGFDRADVTALLSELVREKFVSVQAEGDCVCVYAEKQYIPWRLLR